MSTRAFSSRNLPASRQEIQRLIERALIDDGFRTQLLSHPAETAQTAGITLDTDQVARIRGIDRQQANRIAHEFQQQNVGDRVTPTGLW